MIKFKDIRKQINLNEATTWIPGDGRPRGGSHIENVRFWDLPDASLKYIQKDASDAMKANPEGKKAGKYADEVNDAATVLFWRKKNKIVVESSEIDDHVNEIFDINDAHVMGDITEESSPSDAAIEFFKKKLKDRFSEKKMSSTINGDETWWNHKGTALQFKESVELDEGMNDTSKYTDDKLKAVLKQLKDLDQDAPSTKFMLKKVEKEMKKRGLGEQLEESAISKLSPMAQFKLINDFLGIRQASGVKNFKTDPERAEKIIKMKKVSDKEVEDALAKMGKENLIDSVITEAKKLKASDIVKMMKNEDDWGPDAKLQVYTKGKNFVYIDSFYFTGDKALKDLVSNWSPKGMYYEYFKNEFDSELKIVDSFIEAKATGKHKKYSKDGIVAVELQVQ
jgi:hypothetical protein